MVSPLHTKGCFCYLLLCGETPYGTLELLEAHIAKQFMSILRILNLSLLLLAVTFSGCSSNRSSVQIDRPTSSSMVKNDKSAKRAKTNNQKGGTSLIQQTSANTPAPIKSELETNQKKSLMKSNPISKLIGKFNSKPKRIPLPRTDLNSKGEKLFTDSFQEKETEIPLEDISF
jgi:hypothetical protein